jgi:hypothetical protein
MSHWIGSALEKLPVGPLSGIVRSRRQPMRTQRRLLQSLLRRAADTERGRRYDFARLVEADDAVRAYQETVPLSGYDDLRPEAERLRDGDAENVIWPGGCTHFAVSSGTVSEGKIIPVSDAMLARDRSFSVGVGMNYLAETGDLGLLGGPLLSLPGAVTEDRRPGTLVGEVSGLLAARKPAFIRWGYEAVPPSVWKMEDWDDKLRAVVDRTLERDVRTLVMAPTWGLVLFRLLIDRFNEKHDTNATTVGEVWPNLRLFISGGVALSSYREMLADLIGLPDQMHFLETYGASEGFFALQDDLGDPAMLVHAGNGVFYEFVPVDDYGASDPTRLTLGEVETGQRYALHVSTCSGLWAYDVGDVVRFTQTDPPRIKVAGRTSSMLDGYGEAVFAEEAREALRRACREAGGAVRDFHVAPVESGDLPAHQWLVEFEQAPTDRDHFAGVIDRYLQDVNRHYQIRRDARAFGPPEIEALPEGTFRRWLDATNERVSAQTKVPRLSEARTVADHILRIVGNNA